MFPLCSSYIDGIFVPFQRFSGIFDSCFRGLFLPSRHGFCVSFQTSQGGLFWRASSLLFGAAPYPFSGRGGFEKWTAWLLFGGPLVLDERDQPKGQDRQALQSFCERVSEV
jgi:hypothetical protein